MIKANFPSIIGQVRNIAKIKPKQYLSNNLTNIRQLTHDAFEQTNRAFSDKKNNFVFSVIETVIKKCTDKINSSDIQTLMTDTLKGIHKGAEKGGFVKILTNDLKTGIKKGISENLSKNRLTNLFKPLLEKVTFFAVNKLLKISVVNKALEKAFVNIGKNMKEEDYKELFNLMSDELCKKLKNKFSVKEIEQIIKSGIISKLKSGEFKIPHIEKIGNSDISEIIFNSLFKLSPEKFSKMIMQGIEGGAKSIIDDCFSRMPLIKKFISNKFNNELPKLKEKVLNSLKTGQLRKALDDGAEEFYQKPGITKALASLSDGGFGNAMEFIDKKMKQIIPDTINGIKNKFIKTS